MLGARCRVTGPPPHSRVAIIDVVAIGDLIRSAREAAGLSQRELALRAGTKQSTISAYENGRKTPSAATLERLAEAAGSHLVLQPDISRRAARPSAVLHHEREAVMNIAARHGATEIAVFGSVARGEDTPESDVDLLVTFEPGRSLVDQAALMRALEGLLGVPVEIVSAGALRPGDPIATEARPW